MAVIRSPNRDFTLGVPASRIMMVGTATIPTTPVIVPSMVNPVPTPVTPNALTPTRWSYPIGG